MPEKYTSPESRDFQSYDTWLTQDIRQQYKDYIKAFNKINFLDILPDALEKGVIGSDLKEYPMPKLDQIEQHLEANQERFEAKREQGFSELQMTPFAFPINYLIRILKKEIINHHQQGKLFSPKENQDEPDELLQLDQDQPVRTFSEWLKSDENNTCLYYPKQFDPNNHQGRTKQQIIDSQTLFPGWKVSLVEKSVRIPRQGQGRIIGGRKQLEANLTPEQYLKTLQTNPQYKYEQGFTLEDWITRFLVHLQKTNQVIDDHGNGKDSACCLLGSYLPAFRCLGYADWNRFNKQANLNGLDARGHGGNSGSRSAVGLEI